MSKYFQQSLDIHRYMRGKWAIKSKVPLQNRDDLSTAYSPGVAAVSNHIASDKASSYTLTMKGNSVAIVSDGSAVLGLGDIGPEAALPVMEGKAILFKEFADIDGVPLVIDAESVDEIVTTVKTVAPTFGGINLEDIAAPKCFEIEQKLQDIGIPVFHDDQHGTAIVLLAALINACKVTGKDISSLKVVINGAGAAGTAIARLLRCVGHDPSACIPVEDVLVCDSKGIISKNRDNLNNEKIKLLAYTNRFHRDGNLLDALKDADVFIGVSKGNLLTGDDIKLMNKDPIILAMANPIPEIMPDEALAAGASVVGTGRSDFPNQVNNVLAFPGIFRGALDARATKISEGMKIAAAHALAGCVTKLSASHVLPDPLNRNVAQKVSEAVKQRAIEEKLQRPD
ncbi:NADP-dependent malic enzyme [Kangiella sp. HZ709]|uniref:NAD(P)-dependent malic enzyme n=1 Tax=Kangiella sp. HZ709 TaxID=2666328 RepID=UPI0012AFC9FE|nr:NADP-dependent malic enzyme [Kangiella sp. HZ709]MRX27821.1 NAD-dependent malic enzyme [Kangiella sp. HZ709]